MTEIWKPIPHYEGLYEASNLGRIRTAANKVTFSVRHGVRHWKQRILKYKRCADFNKIGYRVTLWKNKKPKDFLVARLVCTTWHENLIDTDMTVNHIDGNRLNNNINNLEWLTLADNIRHGFKTGLYKKNQICVKLQDENGKEYSFNSMSEASRFLNRGNSYLSNLIKKNKAFAKSKNGLIYKIIF
jgi:hypothetical protein